MSIFGKLMFWRREKDETVLEQPQGFPDETGLPSPSYPQVPGPGQMQPAMPPPSYEQYRQPAFQPSALQSQQAYTASKEMELISAKLDSLRAAVENLSQRIASLERMARDEEDYEARRRGW